jgi:hypothetical protein
MSEQEVIEVQEEQTEEWNKEKQRADMEHANFLKAKQEKDLLAGKLDSMEQTISRLQEAIKVNQEQVEIGELDPLRADVPDLVNQNQKLIARLKKLEQEQMELKSLATQYKTKEQQREQDTVRQKMIDKICKPLDSQYGAKFRTKAVKMAEELVAEGKESQPEDALDARMLLEKCYKQLSSKDETKEEKTKIPTDNGAGAFSFVGSEIKEGSLNDVMGQLRKTMRRKT